MRRDMRRSYEALARFAPKEVTPAKPMFAEARFDLRQLSQHFENDTSYMRLKALHGWTARSTFDRIVNRVWRRWSMTKNVRRAIRVFVGHVPGERPA
jgi:hypothetical protein